MKLSRLLFLAMIVVAVSCSKQETIDQETKADPILKTCTCTPTVQNYFLEDNNIPEDPYFPQTCFLDLIYITDYHYVTQGHLVVAGSCRFNDKGTIQLHMLGVGLFTQHLYEATANASYHLIGDLDPEPQGAQITHLVNDVVITDLTTSVSYTTGMYIKQTINANGVVVVDSLAILPCE